METINFRDRLLNVVPQAFRTMPWVSGLVEGLATQVQELDDATLVMARLIRSIEETPVTNDCIRYSSGSAAVGVVVSTLPTIWVSEIGTPAIGVTLTQTGGATGVVASHAYDSLRTLFRIELTSMTGTWVVGGQYSGTGTVGICQDYAGVSSGTIAEIISGDVSAGVCRLVSIVDDFRDGSILLFNDINPGVCLGRLFSVDNAWLTNLGKVVGFERSEESDDVTVRYLKSQIATNVAWGRIQDLYKVGAALFGEGNVYVDDGGETQTLVPGFGMASRGPMTTTLGPINVVTVKEDDYQRTRAQLLSAKPAGVALWLSAHRTPTGLGTPFRFGLPQTAITTTPNVDTDILWDLIGFTGDLGIGRYYHTATRLADGRVLVVGGIGPSTAATSTCEIWDPVTGNWTATGSMATARYYHTATLLASGKVLIVGGTNGVASLATCEIFDPSTNVWTSTGSMATARVTATAVLPNGDIIACGGFGTSGLATCEVYDVVAGTWSSTGSMGTARYYHTATALASGQILVAGGAGLASTETYDPAFSSWTAAGAMTSARYHHTATLLSTGNVLIIDGSSSSTSCNLFDPATRTCSATGSLPSAQTRHAVSLLADGNVLIAGGVGNGNCNKYTVSTGTWETVDSLNSPRNGATATLTTTGIVLVAGGFYSVPQVTCELYSPSITGEPCAVFNGTTSVITTPALGPSGAAPRSMGCAFYQPIATGPQYFLGYGSTTPGEAFQFKIDASIIYLDIGGTSHAFGTCIPGEWHYVVVTYDGATLKGYSDGTLGLELPITLTTASTGVFRIGAGPTAIGFTRCISHAHLHNRALTETQVQILYNHGLGPDYNHLDGAGEGIIHYYPLVNGTSADFASQFPGWPLVGSTLTQTSPAATAIAYSFTSTGYDSGFVELGAVTGTWTTGSPYTWTYGGGTVTAYGHSGSHFEAPPTPTDTFISIETI